MEKINDCSICYKKINIDHGNIAILSCKHIFCLDCICYHYIRNNSCPLCRKEFAISQKEKNIKNDVNESDEEQEDEFISAALSNLYSSVFTLNETIN